SPGTAMRKTHRNSKAASPLTHSPHRHFQLGGDLSVSHPAQQPVLFSRPLMQRGIEFGNIELSASRLDCRDAAAEACGKLRVRHRAEEFVFPLAVRAIVPAGFPVF